MRILVLSIVVLLGVVGGVWADPPHPAIRAVIFDDTKSPYPSAWPLGLDGIEKALRAGGLSTRRLTRERLNAEGVGDADVLLVGGGYAYPGYTRGITQQGKTAIRRAVDSGVGFVGICAGAWFACEGVVYAGRRYGAEAGYDLSLLPMDAFGPVPTLPAWPSWGLAAVRFVQHAPSGTAASERHLLYGGGPYFKRLPADGEILATYEVAGQPPLPAVVAFRHGKGRVVLWGGHPEIPGGGVEEDNPSRFARVVSWAARR